MSTLTVASIPMGQGDMSPNIYLEWDLHINAPLPPVCEDFNL